MAYAWKSSDEKTKLNEIETEKDTKSIEINKDKNKQQLKRKKKTTTSMMTSSKHAEDKEEGELDDENESTEEIKTTHTYEDDDYEDYDIDEDSPSEDLAKKSEQTESNINKTDESLTTTTTPPTTKLNELPKITEITSTNTEATFQNLPQTSNYDIDEDEEDSDDDDEYGNSKRLKIDESETLNDDKSSEINVKTTNENEINKEQTETKQFTDSEATVKKQIDLDNDNDSSSSLSSKSSASTSSALTAISAISSDSLPISSSGSINQQSESIQTQQEIWSTSGAGAGSNTDSNSENKVIDTIDDEQIKVSSNDSDSLKVPPLKIGGFNTGGHPYVKIELNQNKLKKQKASKSSDELETKQEEDNNNTRKNISNTVKLDTLKLDQDIPANNSRSKSNKTSNRVASPITVGVSSTASVKTTPTRRSAAAAAAAGRSSPAQNLQGLITSTNINNNNNNNNKRFDTPQINPISQTLSDTVAAINATTTTISNIASSSIIQQAAFTNSNETENGIRRKLRSHTRQLQTGDEPTNRSLNIANKSPSPLTLLMNETSTNISSAQVQSDTNSETNLTTETKNLSHESNKGGSDHSNESLADSSDPNNQDPNQPARKKRSRQQIQTNESTISQTINDLDQQNSNQLSNTNAASTITNNMETTSCNSSIDSAMSLQLATNNEAVQAQTSNPATNPQSTAQTLVYNCIKKFIDLRNEITKKRDDAMDIRNEIKLPKNYQDFILFKKNYLIKSNKQVRQSISFFKPPNDMPDDLKEHFFKQEKERHSLRLRHRIEQDKLIILYEQEIMRCFNNNNRSGSLLYPYSFCSIIRDDEVYSSFSRINEQLIPSSLSSSGEQQSEDCAITTTPSAENKFLQNLENLKTKFQKLKEDIIKRQLNESDSLHAVQKMDFQACIRELLNKYKTVKPTVNSTSSTASLFNYNLISQFQQTGLANCVPIVHVNFNKIDLFDISQIYTASNTNNNNNNVVTVAS